MVMYRVLVGMLGAFFLAMVVLCMNERCELRAVRTEIVRGGRRVRTARRTDQSYSLQYK